MGFYNLVFGQNPISSVVLSTLGLTSSDCGRFRDCFIEEDRIAVYTRNGGGNRDCWHVDSPEYGSPRCKHHVIYKNEEETIDTTEAEAKKHPEWKPLNIFCGNKRTYHTGKMVDHPYYVCEKPDSEECGCPGCTIQYRLRQHPLYITDRDDDFDSTYATIYFKFPPEFAEDLRKLASGEKFDPDKKWSDAINALKQKT